MQDALLFLFRAVTDLYLLMFLIRILLQWARADFYNPISQFIVKVTDPLVRPARRIIPSARGFDMPTFVVLVVLELIVIVALLAIVGASANAAELGLFTIVRLVNLVLWFYFFSVLVYVLLSWIGPGGGNPAYGWLARINEPVLRPFRQLIPPIGGLDLSPLVLLLLLQAAQIAIRSSGWLPPLLA